MSFESPKFENPAEIKETEENKEERWEEIEDEVENTADSQGEKVDKNIKEAVVSFQANELPTSGSCEGHLDKGYSYPWIEVSDPNEPEERFVGEKEIYERVAEKYNISIEKVKEGLHKESWVEAETERSKNEETEEYKEWTEKNKELQEKAEELLKEFHEIQEVTNLSRRDLIVSEPGAGGVFRVQNRGGEYTFKDSEEANLLKESFSKGDLGDYRKEMKLFSQFLKDKYFHPEWSEEERKEQIDKRGNREFAAEWFKDVLDKSDKYSERLLIDSNNNLNKERRADGKMTFFPQYIDGAKNVEDLYTILQQVQKENPDLEFSFEIDPKERKWIEYTVKKKQ